MISNLSCVILFYLHLITIPTFFPVYNINYIPLYFITNCTSICMGVCTYLSFTIINMGESHPHGKVIDEVNITMILPIIRVQGSYKL